MRNQRLDIYVKSSVDEEGEKKKFWCCIARYLTTP